MTKIYNYSPFTGEYIDSSEAIISPLEPDVILVPANATIKEPPAAPKGKIAIFKNTDWELFSNFRGVTYWMPDFSQHLMESFGDLLEGASTIPPENNIGTMYWLPDGSKHVMSTYGPLPNDSTTTPPPPTQEQTITIISNAIELALDTGAIIWGYSSIVSAASYVASTNKQYAADASALIEWRDEVWAWAIPQFPNVIAGETPESFMATMPAQPAQPKVS